MNATVSYTATFLLGLMHAMEPGHGKSFLMAFSFQRGSIKVLLSLIFSLFVSHFLLLAVIAYFLQYAAGAGAIEHWIAQVRWLVPALVIGFGAYLLIREKLRKPEEVSCCHHHDEHHDHGNEPSIKNASLTGALAGLIPCPTAIAPLLFSGLNGEFQTALQHILVYVIGMTIALIGIVFLVYILKKIFQRQLSSLKGKTNLNVISAILIIAVGMVYLYQAYNHGGLHVH